MDVRTISAIELSKFIAGLGLQPGLFLQSPNWYLSQNSLVDYLGFFQGNQIIGSAICMSRALPLGQKYIYVPRGPIVNSSANLKDVSEALVDYYKKSGAIFLRLEPPLEINDDFIMPSEFIKSMSIQPASTWLTDLDLAEDDLIKNMHPKTRYNINLSLKKNLNWQLAGPEGLPEFWKLMQVTANRDKFKTHQLTHYKKILDALGAKPLDSDLAVRLALVKQQSVTLAASLLVYFQGVVTYLHGASANEARDSMPTYLLHWRTMQEAKKLGFRFYDWWGINTDKHFQVDWQGITRFKKGFGGKEINYPGTYDYAYKKGRYALYKAVRQAIRRV